MKKSYLIVLIGCGVAVVILGGMFGLQLQYSDHAERTYERSLKAPEVIAFFEKYDNIEKDRMDLNAVFYDAYGDGNNHVRLHFYAGNVSPTPKVLVDCYAVLDGEKFDYRIDDDVLGHIEDYNCFTNKYP